MNKGSLYENLYSVNPNIRIRPKNRMSDLGTRIERAAAKLGGIPQMAEQTGIKKTTLYGWLKGPSEPRASDLLAIAACSGVSLEWLLTGDEPTNEKGRGKALVSSYDPDADENDEGYSHETWKPRIPGARPEIDVRLGAGEGSVGQMLTIGSNGGMSGHRVVAEWVLPEAFLVGVVEANAGRTIVMEIVGDSMQPTYQPGDRVIVDLAQTKLVADTVYAISDGYSEPQIKRLQRVPFSQPPRVRIISDNPALQTDEVELERVHIIGRICGVMARR